MEEESDCRARRGELFFDETTDSITIRRFVEPDPEYIQIHRPDSYHPEDRGIVENWLSAICNSSAGNVVVNAQEALRTHAIVFAAELSRKEKRVVAMSELYDTA